MAENIQVKNERKTNNKKPSHHRYILFENCKSLNDQIKFQSYNNEVQPVHEHFKRHTKIALLKQPSSTSKSDLELFQEEFSSQIKLLKKHYDCLKTNLAASFEISSKLSIKLGYEYFYSQLFRWNNDNLNINELHGLITSKILNTNQLYYKPQNENPTRARTPNPYYQLLKSSFTDHSSNIHNLDKFYKELTGMSFKASEAPIINYRIIYENKFKRADGLFLNSDQDIQNDEFIRDLFNNNDAFELRFDKNFNLISIMLNKTQTESMQSTIDLIRTCNHDNKFDLRFQNKQSFIINLERLDDNGMNLRKLFESFIKSNEIDENNERLIFNCESDQITFLRKEEIIKYNQETKNDLIDFELNIINYDEYRVLSKLADGRVIYEPNIHVNNYVTMTSNLANVFDDFDNEDNDDYLRKLSERIWKLGIWLSNSASDS